MDRPRILLADDHVAMCEQVGAILKAEFDVVGMVANGQELLKEEARLRPDIVVLDISMPVLNGIEAARRLREARSQVRIIFLTIHNDPQFVRAGFAAGGLGYVVKSHLATDLLVAIREVLAGHEFISPALQQKRDGGSEARGRGD